MKPRSMQTDWITKTLAGVIAGFFIAIALSGLFLTLALGISPSAQAQLMMWMMPPIWLTVLSLCYLFRSGLTAWLWLGGASVLLYSTFILLNML